MEGKLTTIIIGILIVAVILGALLPLATDSLNYNLSASNVSSGVQTVSLLIPLVIVIGVILVIFKELGIINW